MTLDNMIWVCGHFQGSLWVSALEPVSLSSSSSPNTTGMPPYLPAEPTSLMKTKHFFFLNLFSPFLLLKTHPFFPKQKDHWDFQSEFWVPLHLRLFINYVLYGKALKIIAAVVGSQDNEKQLCSSPCSVSSVVINELWRFGVNDPYHIELSFFIADNWRWLRSRASVRLNLIGNLLSLMSDVDLYYLMKLGPQWNGFYYTEWAGWALFHFSVFLTSSHP